MSYFANHWDLWLLYHKVTFDGVNRQMYVTPEVSTINVERDLYSDWKEWSLLEDNVKYTQAMRSVGGDPLPNGDKLGNTFFLTNGWRIVLDHSVDFVGNLFTDETTSPFVVQQGVHLSTSTVSTLPTKIAPDLSLIQVPTAQDIAFQVWNMLTSSPPLAGSYGQLMLDLPTLTTNLVPNAVWDAQTTSHLAPGTTGEMMSQIKADTGSVSISNTTLTSLVNTVLKYEKNRTKIDTVNKQMIVYDNDGTTVLQIFNLKDSTGAPSIAEVAERVPTL